MKKEGRKEGYKRMREGRCEGRKRNERKKERKKGKEGGRIVGRRKGKREGCRERGKGRKEGGRWKRGKRGEREIGPTKEGSKKKAGKEGDSLSPTLSTTVSCTGFDLLGVRLLGTSSGGSGSDAACSSLPSCSKLRCILARTDLSLSVPKSILGPSRTQPAHLLMHLCSPRACLNKTEGASSTHTGMPHLDYSWSISPGAFLPLNLASGTSALT